MKKGFLHWKLKPDGPEGAKLFLVQTFLEIPPCPSRKLQLRILVSSFHEGRFHTSRGL